MVFHVLYSFSTQIPGWWTLLAYLLCGRSWETTTLQIPRAYKTRVYLREKIFGGKLVPYMDGSYLKGDQNKGD